MVTKKFHLEGCQYSLITKEKLTLANSENLEQHGFGNLYSGNNILCLLFNITRPRSARFAIANLRLPFKNYEKSSISKEEPIEENQKSNESVDPNSLSLEDECTTIIYKMIDEAINRNVRVNSLTENLKGMTSGQLSSIENFILSLKEEPPRDDTLHKSVGPIYRRR